MTPRQEPSSHTHPMTGMDNYAPQEMARPWFLHSLLAATLGNTLGGGLLVGLACWFIYLRDRRGQDDA